MMINSIHQRRFALKFMFLFMLCFSFTSKAQTYVSQPYYTGFEGGLGTEWTTSSTLATNGVVPILSGTLTWGGQTALSHSGNYFLGMHYPTGGSYNLNQANLHLNLAGESNLRFDFWWAEWNDETEVQDGIFISDDGGTSFTKVLDLNGASYTDLVYTHFDLSLDSINTVHGLTFTSTYIIRLQQYDNYYFAGGNDGFLFDDITIKTPCSTVNQFTAGICGGSYTPPSGNGTYTQPGIYLDVIPNTAGCDSLLVIDLQSGNSSSSLVTTSCGTYTAPDGVSYSTSGNYTAVIPNTIGCDSIISIDLTVSQPTTSTLTVANCYSYTTPSGATITSSGIYNDTILNSSGCDSVIVIDVTINQTTTSSVVASSCYSYNSPAGNTYTSSGMYYDTITSAAGCDSIVTIDLTVNQATTSSITATGLDTYTSPGGNVYTTSGIYYDTIPNAAGCDSIITIDLTMQYTGLDENGEIAVSLFPNPASSVIHLSGIEGFENKLSMTIVTTEGKLVTEFTPTSEINVAGLANGSYFLVIRTEYGQKRIYFVKQ